MFEAIRSWKQKRVLATSAIPDPLWREALESLPFLAIYTESELARLRERTVLFLASKSIVPAKDFEVTPLMRVVIAIQACVLILNLDPRYYDGWKNVIVYPDEFITGLEYSDDAGVVHRETEPMAGEAMEGGPVLLSWPDVEASADWSVAGMNLVIHEFAHKIDMRNGEANGCPPLPVEMPPRTWQKTMHVAYDHFRARVEAGEETVDRSLRGGERRRILRGAVGGVLCRSDAAAARISGGVQAAGVVLQAGSGQPHRAPARSLTVGTNLPGARATIRASLQNSAAELC